MHVQAKRGDGGVAPTHLQPWCWNSVGCWPVPYPSAVCWQRPQTLCTGGWMDLRPCLVRRGKSHLHWILISGSSRMTRVWFQTGTVCSPCCYQCCCFFQYATVQCAGTVVDGDILDDYYRNSTGSEGGEVMKLITLLHVVLKLRMCAVLPWPCLEMIML